MNKMKPRIKMAILRFRLERCYQCRKRIINYGFNLAYDLYTKQKDVTLCKKCTIKFKEKKELQEEN